MDQVDQPAIAQGEDAAVADDDLPLRLAKLDAMREGAGRQYPLGGVQTATITAKVGFAYADGVDSTAVPQDDDFFGTGITVATAGRYRNATSNTSVTLPKEAWLTLTTAVAANAKASELEIIVFAINEGVV